MNNIAEYLAQLDTPIAINIRDDSNIDYSANYSKENFSAYINAAKQRLSYYYGETDAWLYQALQRYPITGMNVLLIGSANPWYEAICLTHGAASVTVMEYGPRPTIHPAVRYVKPHELTGRYDACLNISSVEHDGLGRYGDPIDANGDLKTMANLTQAVAPYGLHYLAVPVGRDLVAFNVHRIYGSRLINLCERWQIIDIFGFHDRWWLSTVNNVHVTPYQPLIVLRNSK